MDKEIREQKETEAAKPDTQKSAAGAAAGKGRSLKPVIWICAAVVVLLAVVFAVTRSGAKPAGGKNPEQAVAEETMEIGSGEDRETFEIPFAGLVLKYPKEWQDQVTVTENEDGSLAFSADGALLFTLYSDDAHQTLGTVTGEKNTVIGVQFAEIDPNDAAKAAMQEDINVILLHLAKDYDFAVGTAVLPEDDAAFPITTSVTTLYYPAKWQDQVTVDVSEEKVSFSAGGTPLFDLVFTDCDGYLLGTYGKTPIYIVEYEVSDDTHAAMQAGVNVILKHLMEDEQFVMRA